MHGAPALPAGFPHFRYANPDAPQGGNVVLGLLGTFDSLNPFVVRGLALQQVRGPLRGLRIESRARSRFHGYGEAVQRPFAGQHTLVVRRELCLPVGQLRPAASRCDQLQPWFHSK